MRKSAKITLAGVLGAVALGGIVTIIAAFPMGIGSRDIAPVDDSPLRREVINLPDDQNAFTFYEKAGNALVYPVKSKEFDKIFEGEEWDDTLVREVLDQNAKCLALLADGNRLQRCIVPRVTAHDTRTGYLANWRGIGRLLVVKAACHAQHRETDQVLATLRELLQFASRVESDAGCLIQYLVGGSIREMGMKNIRNLIRTDLLNDAQLKELHDMLGANPPSTQGLVLAWKTEYEIWSNYVDAYSRGELPLNEAGGYDPPAWLKRIAIRQILHPNRTKQDMAMFYSELINQVTNTYANTKLSSVDGFLVSRQESGDKARRFAKFGTSNRMGAILCGLFIPPSQAVVKRKCSIEVSYAATTTLAAIYRFRRESHTLPESLGALASGFLVCVPADAYDGQPLRYSREKAILYSVGEDLQDSGGSREDLPNEKQGSASREKWKGRDLVFGIVERIEP